MLQQTVMECWNATLPSNTELNMHNATSVQLMQDLLDQAIYKNDTTNESQI